MHRPHNPPPKAHCANISLIVLQTRASDPSDSFTTVVTHTRAHDCPPEEAVLLKRNAAAGLASERAARVPGVANSLPANAMVPRRPTPATIKRCQESQQYQCHPMLVAASVGMPQPLQLLQPPPAAQRPSILRHHSAPFAGAIPDPGPQPAMPGQARPPRSILHQPQSRWPSVRPHDARWTVRKMAPSATHAGLRPRWR